MPSSDPILCVLAMRVYLTNGKTRSIEDDDERSRRGLVASAARNAQQLHYVYVCSFRRDYGFAKRR